jgi:hypothetical protein
VTHRMYSGKLTRSDVLQRPIVEALRDAGATVVPIDHPLDLLVGYKGHTLLLEVKSDIGSLTPTQQQFWHDWEGGQMWIVRSTDQALQILKTIDEVNKHERQSRI